MALPTSGSLSICDTAGTSRSIARAVTTTTSGSLNTLSCCAGKTAPHSMLEFYGYGETSSFDVNMTVYNETGFGYCVVGTSYLKCCDGTNIRFQGVSNITFGNSCSWTWSSVEGCVYVDMNSVVVKDSGGAELLANVSWSISSPNTFGNGGFTTCFSGENNVTYTYQIGFM